MDQAGAPDIAVEERRDLIYVVTDFLEALGKERGGASAKQEPEP